MFQLNQKFTNTQKINYKIIKKYDNYFYDIIFDDNLIIEKVFCNSIKNNLINHPKLKNKTEIYKYRFNLIHDNKYGYDNFIFKNSNDKINIICYEHGEFSQYLTSHLKGSGCKYCGIIKSSKNNTKTTEKFIFESNKIHKNLYDYSKVIYKHSEEKIIIICKKHGEFEQTPSNHLKKQGCKKCFSQEKTLNIDEFYLRVNKIHENKYKYFNDYISSREKIKINCSEHGEFKQTPNNHLDGHGCPKCSNIISKAELEIVDWLKEIGINNIQTSNRNILNNKELDIYLPDHKLAIEFNGIYWHSEDYKDDNYHLQKTEECLSKGITLIHIFEDEWLMKKNIVKSRIKNLLKLTKSNKTIYARNTFIKEIDSVQARKFLDNNHLQGFVGAKIHLGLFYKHNNNEYLVSYMSFGNLRKNLGQREINDSHYELLRFCNFIDYRVIGGASKLLKYFEKTYKPERIISYADRRWSTGNLYEQLKFTLSHKSKPNYFYLEGNKRHNRFGYRKDILISKYNCNPEMTEKEFCRDILGLTRIYDCGNLVYEKKYNNI